MNKLASIFDLLIPIAVVAAIIGFILFYYRDYIFKRGKKKLFFEQQIDQLLAEIRQKSRQQQFKEAAMDVWRAFTLASYGYLDITRNESQTARQYGISFLQFESIDQEVVMSIVELFEHGRYGVSPISQGEFNKGLSGLHRFLQAAQQISQVITTGEPVEEEAMAME